MIALAAISIPTGSPLTQNFDGIGTTATATLPTDFRVDNPATVRTVGNYANGLTATARVGGANLATNAANGIYNFGAGANTAGADRAIGFLSSGTATASGNLYASLVNSSGSQLNGLQISYNVEKYRGGTNAAGFCIQMYSSTDGVNWTSAGAPFLTSFPADATNNGFATAPGATVNVTQALNVTIPDGGAFFLDWNYSVCSGSTTTNAQALAIDDISILGVAGTGSTSPSGVGSASPSPVTAGSSVLLTVAVSPGTNPASTGITVTGNLTSIGGSATQAFFDDGSNGDAVAGDGTWSFSQAIPAATSTGAKTLPVSISDAQARTGSASISLTVNAPPPPAIAINQIQGSGSISPFVGQTVSTTGIVTARRFNNGFFIQTPDGQDDGNPNTSEGLFIFTSSVPPATAAVGNLVQVTGTVSEFIPSSDPFSPPETELVSPTVSLITTGNPLPTPVTLTAADTSPAGSIEQLEKYEGMRVHVDSLTASAPTQGTVNEANATSATNGVFYAVITGIAQPLREPGVEVPDPLPPGSPANVTRFDANPERLRVDSNGQADFGANETLEVTTGAIITNMTGVLDYGFRTYTILPDHTAPGTITAGTIKTAAPIPAPRPDELTIASFNMERFFDTVDDPGVSDVALTPAALLLRQTKMSLAIRHILNSPDIIGVEEMENLSNLQALATKINNDAQAETGTSTNYQAYLVEGNDIGGIDVGFLVRSDRVNVIDVTQFGHDTTFTDPNNNQPALLNDRPPLLMHITAAQPGGQPLPITVIVNHLRSLSGVDDPVDGDRVRAKRESQAEFLAGLIQERQDNNPNENIVSIGDYNAFGFSDGYVDVIGVIKGTPVPADQVVFPPLTDFVSPPLFDVSDDPSQPIENRYSYSFDGQWQELDHVLINQPMQAKLSRYFVAHMDADFPESYRADGTRPERISDHDPEVAYFQLPITDTVPPVFSGLTDQTLEATGPGGATTTYNVTATDNIDGPVTATCAPLSGSLFPLGANTVSCTAKDAHNNVANGSFTITVVDTTPPAITVPANITAEATSAAGAVVSYTSTATDIVDGSITPDCTLASGSIFPLGANTVNCTATDVHGNSATSSFTITVVDTTAPLLTVPANITAEATSAAGAIVSFTSSATDLVDGVITPSCVPASGSAFPIGVNNVNCTATDAHGNSTSHGFIITVVDTTPPTVTVPANITAEATSPAGAAVSFTSTATDVVDGAITPTCTPASGSTFPIGTTTVTCSATDAHGNTGSASFTVTVKDTTPPKVTVPANITAEATSAAGAVVTYTATATDLVDGAIIPNCTLASGSTFSLGAHTVNCTATDAHGNAATASFTVTVVDTTAPVVTVPANITVDATSASGAIVNFTSSATDIVDGAITPVCAPASGSTFPIGTTTVTCTATDAHGNHASASFTVTVRPLGDTTPPMISCSKPDGKWHGADVSLTCHASDAGSGLAIAADATFVLSTSTAPNTENPNAFTNSHQVCDKAGNCSTAGPIGGNMVDKRAPQITINAPANNAVFVLNQAVHASYLCNDGGSGIASCSGNVANGALLKTNLPGAKTFTVNAADMVGNSASASTKYAVTYNVCGLNEGPKAVKSGATLPIRFELCDANGRNVSFFLTFVQATRVVNLQTGESRDARSVFFDPFNLFLFTGHSYQYDLNTRGLTAGAWKLEFRVLGDPITHSAPFTVK